MPLRVAMLVLGVALGLWARAVAAASAGMSFAARTSWGWVYLLIVGWSVMVAAVVVLRERRRSALLLYAIGVWWFLTELAGPSVGVPLAFTLGLLLYGGGPALVAHLALGYPTGSLRRWPYRIIVATGYAVLVGVIGVAATAAYDPASTGCLACPANLLSLGADPARANQVNQVGIRLGAAWLLLAVGAVIWRAISARRGTRSSEASVALPSAVCLGVNAVHYLTSLSVGVLGRAGPALIFWQIEGATLLGLAAASCVDLWRTHRARRDLTRLVVHLRDAEPGGLRAALAQRLNDPELRIAYPIDGGRRHVDAEAREMDLTPTADRSYTPLTRSGVELATLVHRSGLLTQPHQVDDLVVSVQLALESERLAAEDLTQLAEIRSSGARIVTAGDAERRRIERDLHDGSQQRLVALLLALRLLQTDAAAPALVAAETELRETLIELRQLAHGVYPVLLKDAGLRAALESLAETRRLTIESDRDERFPDVVESTVYLFVVHLSAAGPTTVSIGHDDSQLLVQLSVGGQAHLTVELDDRVRTLGGNLDATVSGTTTNANLQLPIQSQHP